jgi:FkbM family methyltransferase
MYASSRRNAFPYFFFFFSMMMMMMMTMIMVKSSANGEEEEEVSCRWLTYKEKIQICAHPDVDDVSDAIAKTGRWYDCDALPDLWLELVPKAAEPPPRERSRGEKNYFLDLGAHIGACSLQMLLSTDAFVVSIEANPENFRRLRKTVSNLSDEFKERIKIYNVAASDSIEDVQILRAVGNSGNSVIGKAVKDHAKQDFHDSVSIQAHRLDDILGNVHFSAMKMDVQGYECRALEGMNKIISNMRTIKFEVANRWLLAQGCSDVILFEKLKSFGFDIFRGRAVLDKPIAKDVYDLVAKNRNKNINPETSSWSTSSPSASGDNFRPSRPTLQEYYYNTLTGGMLEHARISI